MTNASLYKPGLTPKQVDEDWLLQMGVVGHAVSLEKQGWTITDKKGLKESNPTFP
jgi:hypothetical protein